MCYSGECFFENYLGDCQWTLGMMKELNDVCEKAGTGYPCPDDPLPAECLKEAKKIFYERMEG